MTGFQTRASDGWELGLEARAPVGPCRGTLLLLHAMMVDARTLDRPPGSGIASAFCERGFQVFTADLRGRGASGPTVSQGGTWSYDDLVQRDVPALVSAVAARSSGPLWVVGHSLGSHVAAASIGSGACLPAPHGLVLIAGNIWLPSLEGSRRRRLEKSLALGLFGAGADAVGRWPSRRLRMGSVDEAMPYVQDLCRFWREDSWCSRQGVDYLASLEKVSGPVLAVTGAADRLFGHVEGARAFAERFGPGRADFVLARSGRRGLRWDPDHMGIVTDARSRPVWDEIADWIDEHAP